MEENKNVTPEQQPGKKARKGCLARTLKAVFITALVIIGLNVALYILLSIPFIQNKLVGYVTDELKSMTNTEIRIDKIHLSLFNHATINGLYVEDLNKDTLVYAQLIDVKLSPWRLLRNELLIDEVVLDNFTINVNARDSVSDYNFQFLIDAFASDTVQEKDTTSGSSMNIIVSEIAIRNGRLRYDILDVPRTPHEFNASHIALSGFNANLNVYSIDPEKLDINLNQFEVREHSGLHIKTLQGHVTSEGSNIKADELKLELASSSLILNKAEYNTETNEFVLLTDKVEVSPLDVRYFLPNAKFINNNLKLDLDATGKLPQIDANKIYLSLGKDIILDGSAHIGTYEDLENSTVNARIEQLSATPEGITSLVRLGDSAFVAPDILHDMGTINLTADLSGKLKDLHLDAAASINQGSLLLKASGSIDTSFTNFDINANLRTQNFRLGDLLADSTINHLSMHVDAHVLQNTKESLMAEATGAIDLLQYQNTDLKDMPLTAHYNSKDMGISLDGDLPIGKLALNAKMTQDEIPDIFVDLKVDELAVPFFYENDYWIDPKLSFRLNGEVKGLDIDKLSAKIMLDSLVLKDSTFNFRPGLITLDIDQKVDSAKSIELESALISANIKGRYLFSTLPEEISNMMHDYLSNVFLGKYQVKHYSNDFFFTINVENTEELGQIFRLPVDVVEPLNLKGRINTIDKQIAVLGFFPYLRSGDIYIKEGELDIFNIDSTFNVGLSAMPEMDESLYNFSMKMNGSGNSIHSYIKMGSNNLADTGIDIEGEIESVTQFTITDKKELQTQLQVEQSNVDIGKVKLNLLPARIVNVGNRTMLENFGINLDEKRYFHAGGYISDLPEDTLRISFDNAQIGDLLSIIDINNIKASIHGDVKLNKIIGETEVYTESLTVDEIIIFGDTLGTLDVYCAWNETLGGIKIDSKLIKGENRLALINGMVDSRNDGLDLRVDIDRFSVGWLEPFMAGVLNKLDGTISAGIDVKGTMKEPITSGFLGFNNTSLGIDYTNVTYTISDTIDITPEKIGFDNLTMLDNEGNKAIVNATATHRNFQDLKYSLDMKLDELMFLNTQSRTDSMFYGKVYASGTVKLSGDEDNIRLNMNIRNDKKSKINILIPESVDAQQYQSVVYINVPEEKLAESQKTAIPPEDPLPLIINSNITLTPDIDLHVIIDQATGDEMNVNGNGQIAFNYDMRKDIMTTYGDYTINDGNVRLNIQNLKKLEFKIRSGSKLSFVGDPMKTKFNIIAYRRVKADLRTLDSSFDTEESSSRVNVDCLLGISGNIDKMNVTYDIDLPDASDDIKSKVRSLITTDEQKITQFAYLVIGNTFHSQSGGGTNLGGALWTSMAASTLSGSLNSLLGNVLGEKWEIGTNIESGDGTFNEIDVSLDISTRVFNDKLKLHTNVGYNQSTTTDDTFIGDFDAEYQLNNNWLIRAFNRTNDTFYKQASMTQGVGIVYTKEAATLKQLFIPRKKRKRRNNIESTESREKRTQDKQSEQTEGNK